MLTSGLEPFDTTPNGISMSACFQHRRAPPPDEPHFILSAQTFGNPKNFSDCDGRSPRALHRPGDIPMQPRRLRNRSSVAARTRSRVSRWASLRRLGFEMLEDRTMLTSGSGTSLSAIVVGRVQSTGPSASPAYFVGEVQNHQVTLTYTAYNEAADP